MTIRNCRITVTSKSLLLQGTYARASSAYSLPLLEYQVHPVKLISHHLYKNWRNHTFITDTQIAGLIGWVISLSQSLCLEQRKIWRHGPTSMAEVKFKPWSQEAGGQDFRLGPRGHRNRHKHNLHCQLKWLRAYIHFRCDFCPRFHACVCSHQGA